MRLRTLAPLIALVALGCEEEPLLLRPMSIRAVPVDSTEEGELPEGPVVAFEMHLPRGVRIKRRDTKMFNVVAKLEFEDTSNYFRDRLEGGKVVTGPDNTRFRGATVVGSSGKHKLDVDILKIFQGVRIIMKTRTAPERKPPPKEMTEKERWGRIGLTPDGKVLPMYNQ